MEPTISIIFTNTRGIQISLDEVGWQQLQNYTDSIMTNFSNNSLPKMELQLNDKISIKFIEINYKRAMCFFDHIDANGNSLLIMEQTFKHLTNLFDCIDNVVNSSHHKVDLVRAKLITYMNIISPQDDERSARQKIIHHITYDPSSLFDCEVLALGLNKILAASKQLVQRY